MASEDGMKNSSVLGFRSAAEGARSARPQRCGGGCAERTSTIKGSSRKGYCLS